MTWATTGRTSSTGAALLCALLVGCGGGETTGSAVTGTALSNGPISGTVSLNDSSTQTQRRSVTTRPDGTFSVDVAGLTPPYQLKVDWQDGEAPARLFAVSRGNDSIDVNPITDVAFAGALGEHDSDDDAFERSDTQWRRETDRRARNVLVQLQTVIAPLLERYGIDDPVTDRAQVRLLLDDVRIRRDNGIVTVTNRETAGVIFTGPLQDLSSGTFNPANMPPGPGVPPPIGTCTAFTYSAWGACQSNDTQSRTVTSSSPAGCTGGSPVVSQACTYVPPACTYTYSAWSTCSSAGTQTRTVASTSPTGCSGTPVLTQACTPPTQSCGTCHSIPPSTGHHTFHNSRATCATCHGTGYSTTSATAATHQNGVVNVASGAGYNASAGTCANSCHGTKTW
jgi:hypothetical protein